MITVEAASSIMGGCLAGLDDAALTLTPKPPRKRVRPVPPGFANSAGLDKLILHDSQRPGIVPPGSAGGRTALIRQDVMHSSPTVLVYDDAIETSEVLAAIYRPRGFEVRRMASRETVAEGAGAGSAVVMLRSQGYESATTTNEPLRVLIGQASLAGPAGGGKHVAACRLSSLFDYRELVSAIDRLLCGSD
jgi:hypothetical protein